jgi:DNA polymerase III delta subunit
MIYLFSGTDTQKAREKAHALIDALQKKKPDAAYFKQTAETLNEAVLEELTQSQGLFERKFIIYMDNVLEDDEKKELLLEKLETLKESENIFVILERKLDAKSKKAFEKWSEEIKIYDEAPTSPQNELRRASFNIFDITYALGTGNIQKAWMLFDECRRKEMRGEEIHGVLWWQMKKMYDKNPKDPKMRKGLFEIMSMYHEAHRGNIDFLLGLEKWILNFGK